MSLAFSLTLPNLCLWYFKVPRVEHGLSTYCLAHESVRPWGRFPVFPSYLPWSHFSSHDLLTIHLAYGCLIRAVTVQNRKKSTLALPGGSKGEAGSFVCQHQHGGGAARCRNDCVSNIAWERRAQSCRKVPHSFAVMQLLWLIFGAVKFYASAVLLPALWCLKVFYVLSGFYGTSRVSKVPLKDLIL